MRVLFIFFALYLCQHVIGQDLKNRISLELDVRLVPALRSFYSDYEFYNIKYKKVDNNYLITRRNNNFRTAYSLWANLTTKNEQWMIGLAAKYSRVTNYRERLMHPDSSANQLLAANLVADYLGLNLRILKVNTRGGLDLGFAIGGGVVNGRARSAYLASNEFELESKSPRSKLVRHQTSTIDKIEIDYDVKLYDFYINYVAQYPFNINEKVTLFVGCELPLIRLFMFNDFVRFGLSFNDENFFTGFESYLIDGGDEVSGNKNFAYSMKKVNSLSFNFGLRYALN